MISYNVTLVDDAGRTVNNFELPVNPRFLACAGHALFVADKLPASSDKIRALMLADAQKMGDDLQIAVDEPVRVFQRLGSSVHITVPNSDASMRSALFVEVKS